MYKNLRWKFLIIAVVTGLSIWSFVPPSTKVRLGLDLKGGIHLVMLVHTDDALRLETETVGEQLQQALAEAKMTVTVKPGLSEFVVEGVPPGNDQQFRQIADLQAGTSFDRAQQAEGVYLFRMRPNVAVQRRQEALTQALQTIERRVNALGVSEPVVAPYGTGDQIVVQLPGLSDVRRAEQIIGRTAVLEWKLVEAGPAPDEASLLSSRNGVLPPDMEIVPGLSEIPGDTSRVYYLVRRAPTVSGRELRNARDTLDEFNAPAIAFSLDSQGAAKFSAATRANIGRQIAIVLDNQVVSAPVIESAIGAEGRITGRFTRQEAVDLALVLRSGALPATLTYQERREVGPSLGQDSIRAGVTASLTGLAIVTLFMLVYYRLAGINALVSISLNLIILLGFMAYIGAAMTLPGIAGFILTIGMGVDSNVLIFERIREELAAKKGVKQAISASFDRVFITILDTHIASLIAAAFLFQFGTGPIQGFATTLTFGLLANVFTAVFVSRTVFEFVLSRRPAGATQLSV